VGQPRFRIGKGWASPQSHTGQQHKLKKMRIRLLGLLLGLVTAAVVAQFPLFLANLHTRHRAESLLISLRSLQLKLSTVEDTKPLLDRYKAEKIRVGSGCASADAAYDILLTNDTIDYLGVNHPFLLKLGVRPVSAQAVLLFSGNRLCKLSYSVVTLIAGGAYPTNNRNISSKDILELDAETSIQELDSGAGVLNGHYGIFYYDTLLGGSRWPAWRLGMQVTVSPGASADDFQHALDFNLSCFASLRGCRALCQLLPAASQDGLHRHRTVSNSVGTNFPENETNYPACALRN
jgi:hypothetical protein